MTRQEKLEWLARNVHEWPSGIDTVAPNLGETGKSDKFTRLEWLSMREKLQNKPELDNSWHERGEFPGIGSTVTVDNSYDTHDIGGDPADCIGAECVVMATFERDNGNSKEKIVCVMEPRGGCYCFKLHMIRPLRTEREKAIDEMKQYCAYPGSWFNTYKPFAEALYDAGLIKEQAK